MWAALHEGELLTAILTDFYTRVFDDPQLAPYFHGVTRQRLIEKVYSFMRQLFTGEKTFFGDRPRNAHHWMVISEELFDHREALMASVLRQHGLAAHLIERWQAIENSFRSDIVKAKPWIKIMAGVEMPLDGYGEITVTVGTLCDGCASAISPGQALLRRSRTASAPETRLLRFGALSIDPAARAVTLHEQPVALSSNEFDLLLFLVTHAGEIQSLEALYQQLYRREYNGLGRTLDVRISHLRRKLADTGNPEKIRTVWGHGYLFVPDAW